MLRALSEAINTTGSDARAEVRFRFHGDLAAVLPADGPLHAGNLFDVLAEPEIDPYRLTIDGYLLDGKVCLDWRADRALLGQLLAADIPNQTLRRMIGLVPATVGDRA